MKDIFAFLDQHGIAYEKHEHPAVFTCEEAEKLMPDLPGTGTKNLFLKDKKGRMFLVVVSHEKQVDLKALGDAVNAKSIGFASAERLKTYLGVKPGSATLLGLLCDQDHKVELIIDEEMWKADALQCHPLVNTATLVISHEGIEKFLEATKHEPRVMEVPER